jgi:EmrB/QacA subfamily drug resistance transporter
MSLLDVSIVNVALPSIERDLAAPAATVQWVVSGYALTLGLVLVLAGRLGDTIGRRRMFLISLSAFVVTSALTGAAPTIELLVIARLVQGVAGGMLIPQNSGLIQDLFRGDERGRAFGLLGATIGLSTAAGPVIGGLILSAFPGPDGWRWVFYVNVPIGLVALALAARLVPSMAHPGRRSHLDVIGALLLGGGVFSLLYPTVSADGGELGGRWPLFGVAALLLAAFAWWEIRTAARGREPLLQPRLARTSGFSAGSGIALIYYIGFSGLWLVMALFYQNGLGYSPLRSGLAVTPFAIGVAASAPIAGRLVPRLGRRLTVIGLTLTVVGLAITALVLRHVTGDAAAWATAAPLLLAGIGGGMVTSPNMTLSLQCVPVSMAGAAGGALQTAQRIGAAIGTAVLAAVFYQVLARASGNYSDAVSVALICACGLMVLALLMAVTELVLRRPRHGDASDSAHPSRAVHPI